MRSGTLRHRITIQRLVEEQDDSGQPVPYWDSMETVWAEVLPLRGQELFSAQQTHAKTTHKIRIRYLDGITARHRVLFGSREMNIDSIINTTERSIELVLMCSEVTP